MAKVVVLGVDGLHPGLVRKWSDGLPHLTKLQEKGIWGKLKTTVPPTLPQVWVSAQCGRDPGDHGIWDFTYRRGFSYGEQENISCEAINKTGPLYTLLPKRAQRVGIINVPVTWPSPKIPAGYAIAGSIPSKGKSTFTYPDNLKEQIGKLVGDYIPDVERAELEPEASKGNLLKRIYDMDSQRFTLTEHFINDKNCDYVMTVVRGANRVVDLSCRYFDSKGKGCGSDSFHEKALHDYYVWVDKRIKDMCENFNKDVVLFICSCFGTQKLDGRINLNEWLIKEGYMKLQEYPKDLTPFNDVKVDWSKTRCWSSSYAGKLYLNLKGREPEGVIDPEKYDELLDEIIAKMRQDLPDELGEKIDVQTWKRADIYSGPYAKYGPDLFVSFNEGRLGTSELVGHEQKRIFSQDVAPYSSNVGYSPYGYFSVNGSGISAEGEYKGASVLNVAPTVLDIFKISIPRRMKRSSILSLARKKEVKKEEEAKRVRSRLEALGY